MKYINEINVLNILCVPGALVCLVSLFGEITI